MPIIRSQHDRDPWRPLLAWPDDCMVQWGGDGIVLSETSYATAFFEAFPGDGAAGFIRGEGATVEAAEASAFAKYERNRDCFSAGGHKWTRARRLAGHEVRLRKGRQVPKVDTYANGGAFCLRCGCFQTALQEVPKLGAWRDPLEYGELDAIMLGMVRTNQRTERSETPKARIKSAKWRRRLYLRARMFGIDLPDHGLPEYQADPKANPFRQDAYTRACRAAVIRFYVALRDKPESGSDNSMSGLFDGLTRRRLDREAEEFLARGGAEEEDEDAFA